MIAGYGPGGTSAGAGLDLLADAGGSVINDPIPTGTVTFTIGPAPWIENAIGGGSTDCSAVTNTNTSFTADWGTGCAIYFSSPGTYTISLSFNTSDPFYGSIADGPTLTVDVTG